MEGLSFYADLLLGWYSENKRMLPWRQSHDPYKVWLSEVILQQTRVNQGLPYYLKFIDAFPSVMDLAQADESQVLLQWQGLGYYSRARNLHKCAQEVVSRFNGIFPGSYEELIRLPGIGPYSAAAIASISFHEKIPVLDGNVFRVLSRLFDIDKEIQTASGKKYFQKLASSMIPNELPGEFNQAIMEFGAKQCVPKNPDCHSCMLQSHCISFSLGNQHIRPVKKKRSPKINRYFNYLVLENDRGIFLNRRINKDIWSGLYDFYLIESTDRILSWETLIRRASVTGIDRTHARSVKEYKHVLTHQNIYAAFYRAYLPNNLSFPEKMLRTGQLYEWNEIQKLPKPVLINKYLKEEIF